MKIFRQLWDDVKNGENIDLYIAAPLAIIIAVLSIFNVASPQLVSSITLVILSLLATSLLSSRRVINILLKKLAQTSESFFFKDLSESGFEKDFEKADNLWIAGVSLNVVVRLHYSLIEKKLMEGHLVRALVVDPKSVAVEMADMRSYSKPNPERKRLVIKDTVDTLLALKEVTRGDLEVRCIDNPLGHGTIAFDPEKLSGIIYIENYPFKTEGGKKPKFVLYAKDGEWYEFYRKELQNLWDSGTPISNN